MNKAMLTIGIILLAVISFLLINLITSSNTGSELDYYLVKETAEAAMDDAVDVSYYRETGMIRMDSEKFVESFLLRFTNSVDNTRDYDVKFYDLNEVPPKVSVEVSSKSSIAFNGTQTNLTTTYDGIIEATDLTNEYVENRIKTGEISSIPKE